MRRYVENNDFLLIRGVISMSDTMPVQPANPQRAVATEVIVIRDSLQKISSCLIHGTIFLKRGAENFPTYGWNDFVTVILEWWLRALLPLFLGEAKHAELLFMEGPYKVDIDIVGPGIVAVKFVDRGRSQLEKLHSSTSNEDLLTFIEVICNACDLILKQCRTLDIQNVAIDRLNNTLQVTRSSLRNK